MTAKIIPLTPPPDPAAVVAWWVEAARTPRTELVAMVHRIRLKKVAA